MNPLLIVLLIICVMNHQPNKTAVLYSKVLVSFVFTKTSDITPFSVTNFQQFSFLRSCPLFFSLQSFYKFYYDITLRYIRWIWFWAHFTPDYLMLKVIQELKHSYLGEHYKSRFLVVFPLYELNTSTENYLSCIT